MKQHTNGSVSWNTKSRSRADNIKLIANYFYERCENNSFISHSVIYNVWGADIKQALVHSLLQRKSWEEVLASMLLCRPHWNICQFKEEQRSHDYSLEVSLMEWKKLDIQTFRQLPSPLLAKEHSSNKTGPLAWELMWTSEELTSVGCELTTVPSWAEHGVIKAATHSVSLSLSKQVKISTYHLTSLHRLKN